MDTGTLVRTHRTRRRLSQMELALAAGISTRHLSFVENGRSRPGRAVLLALARAMGLAHREANHLLRAAGERPAYPEAGLAGDGAREVRRALDRMLEAHMPWPAMVTDHAWNPVRANPACEALVAVLAEHCPAPPGDRGLMDWLFAEDGLRPLVENWDEVGPFLLERIRRESLVHPDLDELHARLASLVEPRADPGPGESGQDVVLPLHLRVGGESVRLFSLLASFGSALDAELQALRVEYICPLDDATALWLGNLGGRDRQRAAGLAERGESCPHTVTPGA